MYCCLYTPALVALLAICDEYGIAISNDSAFPAYAPSYGLFGYGSWRRKKYTRPSVLPSCYQQSCSPGTRCLGLERVWHVSLTRDWLACLRDREQALYSMYRRNIDQYCNGQIVDDDLSELFGDGEQYESW